VAHQGAVAGGEKRERWAKVTMYDQPNGVSPNYDQLQRVSGLASALFSRSLSFSSLLAFVFCRSMQSSSFPSYSLFLSRRDSSEMWIGGMRRAVSDELSSSWCKQTHNADARVP
jgi:hypothetical protein